jgi:antitoxin component of MazEF toxin-antitoxin module
VKKFLEKIGIPPLNSRQVEELCELAETTARKHILSRIPSRKISTLNIMVEIEGRKPVTVNVDVEITLSPSMKKYDVAELAQEATQEAFKSVKGYLRELSCKSKR